LVIKMITVTFYKDSSDRFIGFKSVGHAGAGERGNDVVCAAISILVINTVNSIEMFTNDRAACHADEKNFGYISYRLKDKGSEESQLLLKSLHLGVEGVMRENKKYIKLKILKIKEV